MQLESRHVTAAKEGTVFGSGLRHDFGAAGTEAEQKLVSTETLLQAVVHGLSRSDSSQRLAERPATVGSNV
jgi:hypothetical protein